MEINANLKSFVKPVTVDVTQKILNQMTTCICKVKNNDKLGTGFFCKIPYKNNTKKNALITSSQIIDEYYLLHNNHIKILINEFNEQKKINIEPTRKIYTNKLYNTKIIEIKENDDINNYLELDENLFGYNIKSLFEKESIYILQYLNGVKASVSYGIINELNGDNIKNNCWLESGSNGAPILNLSNNKVIGLVETNDNLNFGNGIILKFPIEDFINKYNFNSQLPNMQINNNFQGVGVNNNQIPNMMMNNNNFLPPNMMNNNNFIMPNMMIHNNFQMPNMLMNNFPNMNIDQNNIQQINVMERKISVPF